MFYISQLNKWILYSDILGVKGKAPKLVQACLVGDWRNTKARARKAIEEIAEDLVKIIC